jgi:hypothetical protein
MSSTDSRIVTLDLPTEAGIYLFAGERDGLHGDRVDDLERTHVELVTVAHDAEGKLRYIGRDFFYRPSKAVGAWIRVSDLASSVEVAGREALLDQFVARVVASLPDPPRAQGEDSLLRDLTGTWTLEGPRVESARAVLARAVATGAVECIETSWGVEYRRRAPKGSP